MVAGQPLFQPIAQFVDHRATAAKCEACGGCGTLGAGHYDHHRAVILVLSLAGLVLLLPALRLLREILHVAQVHRMDEQLALHASHRHGSAHERGGDQSEFRHRYRWLEPQSVRVLRASGTCDMPTGGSVHG